MIEISQYLFYKITRLIYTIKYYNEFDRKVILMEEGKLHNNIYLSISKKY